MANPNDEEYQFSETETPVAYTTTSQKAMKDKDFQNRQKSRNVMLLIGLLMAGWAVYKFIGIFRTQPTHTKPTPSAVIAKPHMMPKTNNVPLPSILPTASLQEFNNQKKRINQLEAQTVDLQTTLSDINTQLNTLSNQVNQLTSQINKPPAPIIKAKKVIRVSKKQRQHQSNKAGVSYTYVLQAAIPGRAWLVRSDGATLTVGLGDKLPGYGIVANIDPNSGVVEMNSGASIK